MSTVATPEMKQLALDWERKCGLSSAVCSGIVGDTAHRARGGYHISRADQPKDNYSVVRPDDGPGMGPDDAAAGIDMSMSTADMKTCTARLLAVFVNTADPRRKYINAFNGWTGTGGAQRWDVYARKVKSATPDHMSHVHLSIRRKYVRSRTAMAAVLSALRGESLAAYMRSIGVGTGLVSSGSSSTTTAPKAPPYPGRVLRRNDAQAKPDPAVKLIQERLIARGWTSLGSADGFFGAKLETVVKKWQASLGLPADGVIGPQTWPTPWTRAVAHS